MLPLTFWCTTIHILFFYQYQKYFFKWIKSEELSLYMLCWTTTWKLFLFPQHIRSFVTETQNAAAAAVKLRLDVTFVIFPMTFLHVFQNERLISVLGFLNLDLILHLKPKKLHVLTSSEMNQHHYQGPNCGIVVHSVILLPICNFHPHTVHN